MNKWLCSTDPYNIPQYAFTNVGIGNEKLIIITTFSLNLFKLIGGVVVDDNDRVLVVKEKHFFGTQQLWKFPGGYAEQGEDFGQTAIREVLEETGIKCEFQSVIAFRHIHKFAFDCSDLYIVCHLKPIKNESNTSEDELKVKKCLFEIDECKWFPIEELKPLLSQFNSYIIQKFESNRQNGIRIGMESIPSIIKNIDHNTYSIHKDF